MAKRAGAALMIGTLIVATSVASGWALATKFKSPAQREAAASAPPARPVFVQVEMRELTQQIQGRGTIAAARRDSLVPAATGANAVITSVYVDRGDQVVNGAAIVAVNGSPLIAVQSPFPFYRDLMPGAVGPDVVQLQKALTNKALTIASGEAGRFGPSTSDAVSRLLQRIPGVQANPTSAGLPLTQLLAVPQLPARLADVLSVGKLVSSGAPVGHLDRGALIVRTELVSADAATLTKGMRGSLELENGRSISVVVDQVAALAGADANATIRVDLIPSRELVPEDRGRGGLVTVLVKPVAGPALVVPSRAVSQGAAGNARVLKRGPDGAVAVEVEVLGTLDGSAAIRPIKPGQLTRNEFVQVG